MGTCYSRLGKAAEVDETRSPYRFQREIMSDTARETSRFGFRKPVPPSACVRNSNEQSREDARAPLATFSQSSKPSASRFGFGVGRSSSRAVCSASEKERAFLAHPEVAQLRTCAQEPKSQKQLNSPQDGINNTTNSCDSIRSKPRGAGGDGADDDVIQQDVTAVDAASRNGTATLQFQALSLTTRLPTTATTQKSHRITPAAATGCQTDQLPAADSQILLADSNIMRGAGKARRGPLSKARTIKSSQGDSEETLVGEASADVTSGGAMTSSSSSSGVLSRDSREVSPESDKGETSKATSDSGFRTDTDLDPTERTTFTTRADLAPLATMDSLETTSISSLHSDDLMMDCELLLDDDDSVINDTLISRNRRSLKHKPSTLNNNPAAGLTGGNKTTELENNNTIYQVNGEVLEQLITPTACDVTSVSAPARPANLYRAKRPGSLHKRNSKSSLLEPEPLRELTSLLGQEGTIDLKRRHPKLGCRPASFHGSICNIDPVIDSAPPTTSTRRAQMSFKPPRVTPALGDEEQVLLDAKEYRQMKQDLVEMKAQLYQLKRLIQTGELQPFDLNNMRGTLLSTTGNTPLTTPTSPNGGGFPTEFGIEDVKKENSELREQLRLAQVRAEEHELTIRLLQQQMTKYELVDDAPESRGFTATASQTDAIRTIPTTKASVPSLANGHSNGSGHGNGEMETARVPAAKKAVAKATIPTFSSRYRNEASLNIKKSDSLKENINSRDSKHEKSPVTKRPTDLTVRLSTDSKNSPRASAARTSLAPPARTLEPTRAPRISSAVSSALSRSKLPAPAAAVTARLSRLTKPRTSNKS